MEFGIEKCAMQIMRRQKRQMMEGLNYNLKKNQSARRKVKLQVFGNIGSGYDQTSKDESKDLKKNI